MNIEISRFNGKWIATDGGKYITSDYTCTVLNTAYGVADAKRFSSPEKAEVFVMNCYIAYRYPTTSESYSFDPAKKIKALTAENANLRDKACAYDLMERLIKADKDGDVKRSKECSDELEAYWSEHGAIKPPNWFASIFKRFLK